MMGKDFMFFGVLDDNQSFKASSKDTPRQWPMAGV
jgi:hypothetical protein